MVMKNDGRQRESKKGKRKHKTIKCSECRTVLDLDEMKENQDYDVLSDGSYVFYCTQCDNTEIVRL
jgi:hypothetical protein